MTTIFKDLSFDKQLVDSYKKANTPEGILYQQLIRGRITLQEYLAAL